MDAYHKDSVLLEDAPQKRNGIISCRHFFHRNFAASRPLYQLCTEEKWQKGVDGFVQSCGMHSIGIYAMHWSFLNISCVADSLHTENEWICLALCVAVACPIAWACLFLKKFLGRFPVVDGILFGGKWK